MSKLGGVSFIRVKTEMHFTTLNEFNIQVHVINYIKKEMLHTYEATQESVKNSYCWIRQLIKEYSN